MMANLVTKKKIYQRQADISSVKSFAVERTQILQQHFVIT